MLETKRWINAIHLVIEASMSTPGIVTQPESLNVKLKVKFPVKFHAEGKQLPWWLHISMLQMHIDISHG